MRHVDFTIQGNSEQLQLQKGKPAELGVEATKYILLTADVTEVRVWLVCDLDSQEKQRLIQGVWSYFDAGNTL